MKRGMIPFNKPYTTGKEIDNIKKAITNFHLSGNGPFTKKCQNLLGERYRINNCLLTTSCTDALEMASILINIQPGDEIIVPSFTFVSTALAFARQGATIIFADSRNDNPCIDENQIEQLITSKTKAIVPVHYLGFPCEMDRIMQIAEENNLIIIEDAANAFRSRLKGRLLGTIGHLGCFSFHETKILQCGEGGMLSINDNRFSERAKIIWEKGTNRTEFQRGEVQKYEWLDIGSSFLLSDINASFLFSQLEKAEEIIGHKKLQWELYYSLLENLKNRGLIKLPVISVSVGYNYSGFYLETRNVSEREYLRKHLLERGIQAVTHYLNLSTSPYILKNQAPLRVGNNENSTRYENTILRLPFYHSLDEMQIRKITTSIYEFYSCAKN